MENFINIGLFITYIMIACAALTAIGFGIKKMIQNTENAKKTLFTIGGLIVILLLSFLVASDEVLLSYEKYEISAATSKQVGMGLISFYCLMFGAIGAILYVELSKVFSK